jgi:D-glycero-D-manno-heptose 1,7-bisphosphate phosphatase
MIPRLVLLDRDGVINHDRADSVKHPDELIVIDGAGDAIARLNQAGIKTAIVTNQANVGRGVIDQAMLESVHAKLFTELRSYGATIDALFVAPDAPEGASLRRKPGPLMLLEAMAFFDIPAEATVMIGDAETDRQAAVAANVAFHLVRTGKGRETASGVPPNVVVPVHDDLAHAVTAILEGGQ